MLGRKSFLIVLLFLSCYQFMNAQDTERTFKKNNVSLNLAGTGIGISMNYARIVFVKENNFLSIGTGVGTVPFSGGLSIPLFASYHLGKNGNYLELGIGGSYWMGKDNATVDQKSINSYHLYPIIGYQRLTKSGLDFRIYANPLVHISGEYLYEDWSITPFLGISIGYSF